MWPSEFLENTGLDFKSAASVGDLVGFEAVQIPEDKSYYGRKRIFGHNSRLFYSKLIHRDQLKVHLWSTYVVTRIK